jgi:hypothetical protein
MSHHAHMYLNIFRCGGHGLGAAIEDGLQDNTIEALTDLANRDAQTPGTLHYYNTIHYSYFKAASMTAMAHQD